jgi:RimJ/RimL family protein N-acetyltransferase
LTQRKGSGRALARPSRSPESAPLLPATWLAGRHIRIRAFAPEDGPLVSQFGLPLGRRGSMFVVQTNDGRDIGLLGFFLRGHHVQIGLTLAKPRLWSDGTAAESLRVFQRGIRLAQSVVRIEALVDPRHLAALRAYRSAGFTKEGLLREIVPRRKRFEDAVIVSIVGRA